MPTLLVKNAQILVTMDDHRHEIHDGGLFIKDGFIENVGKSDQLPSKADQILDFKGPYCSAWIG